MGSTRREFLKSSAAFGAGICAGGPLGQALLLAATPASKMKFGLATYLWGQDWDLPTLIANCQKTGVDGVELRTGHAHGVEAGLNDAQRREVKARFAGSGVSLVGLGTNFAFHYPDGGQLAKDIAGAKDYIKLSHDCGGRGVKVKPNDLPKGVPYEKTIEQIGRSLNELAQFAAEYNQKLRLEVHGGCSLLPTIKAIMDVANHPNVGVCWNCNSQDLQGEGLRYNFNLVRERFGDTVHVRELNGADYPYQRLIDLLVATNYEGWVLLEARTKRDDRVKALAEQSELFEQMVARARPPAPAGAGGVKITEHDDKAMVEIDGKLFTEYCFKNVIRPYFYPVIGPTGVPVIRHWPIKDGVPDESHDHPHHKSLWYTHGAVNGIDFWSDGKGAIVHDKFLQIRSGPRVGVIQSQDNWVAPDGKVVCTDTRTHRFYARTEGTMMDFEVTIHASHGPVTMGDTKEGSMAIRLAPTMQVQGKVASGHILNSEGDTDVDAWGQRATWCDYYGPINDEIVGVAIFDHPSNPRHPTWWHVRDYGLFAANPFGVHDFEHKPAGTGDLVIPAGQGVTFKYRFYFHKGDEKQAKVVYLYHEYAAGNEQDNG
jgi:sugar phosphate isomerase/epimerase